MTLWAQGYFYAELKLKVKVFFCPWSSDIVAYILPTLISFLPCSNSFLSRKKTEIKAFCCTQRIKMYRLLGEEID